jgi:hypothetical protein
MKIKALEIRDKATFIPAIAIKMEARLNGEGDFDPKSGAPLMNTINEGQRYLMARCGFRGGDQIVVMKLNDQRASSDPYYWGNRTIKTAHVYIEQQWDKLKDGDVVDVEFILGETKAPKVSEREEAPL